MPAGMLAAMFAAAEASPQQAVVSASKTSLPFPLIAACAAAALFSTLLSLYSINAHLRAYRKPVLQRSVVRLLVMVPIYSLSSLASITSLEGAFFIDLVRDLYEAFVIYCFFALLVEYLGGERSLLILAHGRPPTKHPFPFNFVLRPMDVSDPYTFLALKRGILQYVQVKPVLAVATVLFKSFDCYEEGSWSWTNGYSYVSFVYNISVFLSLYCLGMFWACLSEDLAPFRVTSKFLCIKGIIFFSFWQGLAISILVAAGVITHIGPVDDASQLPIAVQDMLISLEMPLFAIGHAYAFSPRDYVDPFAHYAARLPALYALRDATGGYDVLADSVGTLSGKGYGYQMFEPSEGVVHQGLGRVRRSRAGLRYTQGGKAKYWLPQRSAADGSRDGPLGTRHRGPGSSFRQWLDRYVMSREGYTPLLAADANEVVHTDSDPDSDVEANGGETSMRDRLRRADPRLAAVAAVAGAERAWNYLHPDDMDGDSSGLEFDDPDEEQEQIFEASRQLTHGDYAYPTVDVGMEEERRRARHEDDDAIRRHKLKKKQKSKVGRARGSQGKGKKKRANATASTYGALVDGEGDETIDTEGDGDVSRTEEDEDAAAKKKQREEAEERKRLGIVDILVEDKEAEERQRMRERRRGDPALRAGQKVRIYRKHWEDEQEQAGSSSAAAPGAAAKDAPAKSRAEQAHAEIAENVVEEEATEAHPEALSGGGGEGNHSGDPDDVVTAEEGSHDHVAHEVEPPSVAEITHYDPPSPPR